jgi:hypothetical protein
VVVGKHLDEVGRTGRAMKRRAADLFLLLVFLIGGVWAWTSGRERGRLEADYRRLTRATGDLPIADPTKVHFRAIETGEPLHFAWRVYLPPNYQFFMRTRTGSMSSSTASDSREYIARVRFREDDGILNVYEHFSGSSSRGSFGDRSLAGLLHGRWEKVLVEQLGAPNLATVEPDGSAVLLRLTLPEDMQAEARKTLDPYTLEKFIPVLFEMEIGPETPKPSPVPPRK